MLTFSLAGLDHILNSLSTQLLNHVFDIRINTNPLICKAAHDGQLNQLLKSSTLPKRIIDDI